MLRTRAPDPRVQRPGLVLDRRAVASEGFRQCIRCDLVKPADAEHFGTRDGGLYLSSWCRECSRAHARAKMAERRARPCEAERIRVSRRAHARSDKGKAYKRARNVTDNNARRQRLTGAPFEWGADEWAACLERWGRACVYCDATDDLTQDHFVPVSAPDYPGTIPANMVPACGRCNRSKGNRSPFAWVKDPARLQRITEGLRAL